MTTIHDLPVESVEEIMLRLPPKELIRSKCVWKSWKDLVGSPRFQKAYLKRNVGTNPYIVLAEIMGEETEEEMESDEEWTTDFFLADFFPATQARMIRRPLRIHGRETEIVGAYNGLLCIRNGTYLAIWNPSIQRFRSIPYSPIDIPAHTRPEASVYGFGYDTTNQDYKIVRVVEFSSGIASQVQIYSMNDNSWKRIQNFPHSGIRYSPRAIPLHGALHWNVTDNAKNEIVVALNLAEEVYYEMSTPFTDHGVAACLDVLGGCLCICLNNLEVNAVFWKMENYGVPESWVLVYTIRGNIVDKPFEACRPLLLSNSGERVLLYNDCGGSSMSESFLFWYNSAENIGERVQIPLIPSHFQAAICVASPTLLFDGDPVIDEGFEQDGVSEGSEEDEMIEG